MKKIIISIVFSLLIIAFFLGFVEKDSTNESIDNNGIVYAVTNITGDLQKVTKLSKRDEDFICATSRGLIQKDIDGNIKPMLANDIKVKDNGIEYEFTLSNNIYWSDGSKIQGEDIVRFFKELIKCEDEENISALLDVYGAKEFRKGKVNFKEGVAISNNSNIITIRLNTKNDNFLKELTKPQYRLRSSLPLWSDLYNSYNKINYSGEYRIQNINDTNVELIKNDEFKDDSPQKIQIVKDENEELSMASFEIGSRDIVINPPSSQLDRLYEQGKLITLPSQEATYIALNSDNTKLSALDRREIYKIIYDAAEIYEGENTKRIEVAEGSYFREDKDDLSKLQSRKVSLNRTEKWNKPSVITLLAVDNNENKDFCKFLFKWFKEKHNIELRYSLVDIDEINNVELQKRYSLIMVNIMATNENRKILYSNLESLYTEKEEKLFKDEVSKENLSFRNLEEELYTNYRILPVIFRNKNIAISDKVSNLCLDGNGNIDFSLINKVELD